MTPHTPQPRARDDLVARLRRVRANGDPHKYLSGITVAEAHHIANRLEKLAEERDYAVRWANRSVDQIKEGIDDLERQLADARAEIDRLKVALTMPAERQRDALRDALQAAADEYDGTITGAERARDIARAALKDEGSAR